MCFDACFCYGVLGTDRHHHQRVSNESPKPRPVGWCLARRTSRVRVRVACATICHKLPPGVSRSSCVTSLVAASRFSSTCATRNSCLVLGGRVSLFELVRPNEAGTYTTKGCCRESFQRPVERTLERGPGDQKKAEPFRNGDANPYSSCVRNVRKRSRRKTPIYMAAALYVTIHPLPFPLGKLSPRARPQPQRGPVTPPARRTNAYLSPVLLLLCCIVGSSFSTSSTGGGINDFVQTRGWGQPPQAICLSISR